MHLIDLCGEVGEALAVFGKRRFPVAPRFAAALADTLGKVLHDSVGHQELGILRPVIGALDELHFVFPQGLAMGRGGIDLVRRAIADVAVENDQRRPVFRLAEDRERLRDALKIVGIADPQHIPMVGEEARGDIFGKGDAGLAVDGDVIVVVDPTQVVESEMAGERRGLRADAFHHAAVAADGIDVVVEEIEAGLVVAAGKPFARDGHADTGGDALTERTCRRLHAGDQMIFRMPRSFAAELAEMANVVERDRGLAKALVLRIHRARAGQIQHRPQQHGGVAV